MTSGIRSPWDIAHTQDAQVEDLSEALVREHLHALQSDHWEETNALEIYRSMGLTVRVNDRDVPRNIALLFFSHDPAKRFRGAKIEVVVFAADRTRSIQAERTFSGGLTDQIRNCLNYLESFKVTHLVKHRRRNQHHDWVNFPTGAVKELLVNAVYHRGYDVDQPEPTKVYLYPDRLDVISYPGPALGIELEHFDESTPMPAIPARNHRIGEYLKELGLVQKHLSGLHKVYEAMRQNGSPPPHFDFDENRSYFRATLPVHPEYLALSALRDAALLKAVGELEDAQHRIKSAWESNPAVVVLAEELIRIYGSRGEPDKAEEVFQQFEDYGNDHDVPRVENSLIEAFINSRYEQKAQHLLESRQSNLTPSDAIDAAVLAGRMHNSKIAHQLFTQAGDAVYADSRVMLEFAQAKIHLAQEIPSNQQSETKARYLDGSMILLEQLLQMDTTPNRHAWAWRELARVRERLGAPIEEVKQAYGNAIELLPEEQRFKDELSHLLSNKK